MGTSINAGNPSASSGLTAEEAQARLARDGPNQLTPPKKKSALRKVS
jgi:sodium/potassium-transporting ATPase subunit alpha